MYHPQPGVGGMTKFALTNTDSLPYKPLASNGPPRAVPPPLPPDNVSLCGQSAGAQLAMMVLFEQARPGNPRAPSGIPR